MRKVIIILIVLFGVFLAIGCAGNKPVAPNETGISEKAVTPAEAITEAVKETPATEITPAEVVAPTGEKATEMQNVTEKPELQEYTLEELAEYNGKNGKIYVAYQNQVYDISNSAFWKNGSHNGCNAGTDLTGKMDKTPHGSEILKNYPVVGTLKQ